MKMAEPIKLRGHHLAVFANYLFRNKKEIELIPTNPNFLIGLPPEKDFREKIILEEKSFSNSSGVISTRYSPEMNDKVFGIWKDLETVPETQVEIVNGLDSICEDCPRCDSECIQTGPNDEDTATLEEYGLKAGRTYTSRDIISRLNSFYFATCFHSPRSRALA